MKKYLSAFLIFLGVIFLIAAIVVYWQRTNPRKLSFNNTHFTYSRTGYEKGITPVYIKINALGINLPVFESEIINGNWESTTDGISYLRTSTLPGNQGNSILYGHNRPNLLGNLHYIKLGDKIEISFNDSSNREFIVSQIVTVTPDMVSVLENSESKKITLYTCTGFLDTKRLVVSAILKE